MDYEGGGGTGHENDSPFLEIRGRSLIRGESYSALCQGPFRGPAKCDIKCARKLGKFLKEFLRKVYELVPEWGVVLTKHYILEIFYLSAARTTTPPGLKLHQVQTRSFGGGP